MADLPKCTSYFGHKFEGRYSSEPTGREHAAYKAEGATAIEAQVLLLTRRTYERDICVRCGVTVERMDTTK